MPPGGGMRGGARGFLTDEEKANKPKVTWPLIKRILSYLKPYWKQMAIVLLCIGVSSVLGLLPSVLTGRIIDEGLIGRNLKMLITLILVSLGVTFGSHLIGVGESYLNNWIAQHISFDMRNKMYHHLQKMSQRFFTSNNQGDIITRMTSDISGVERVVTSTFTSILSNTITLICAIVIMFRQNPILAVVGMLVIPLFVIPTRMAGKTRWKLTQESQECSDEINGILNETLSVSGQLLVKLFHKEEYEYEKYKGVNKKMIRLNIRESMAGRWFMVIIQTFSSIGPMLLYLVGGIMMMKYDSDLTVGDITVLVALLGRMYGPVNSLLNIQVEWIRSMALFTRIFDYYDMPIEVDEPENPLPPNNLGGTVEFRSVDFSYDSERQILKNVSFKLESGHSIAIVGPSGSGKSTMINLIPRLYDVQSGQVLFDGVDVRDLDLGFLRESIGIVSQETYLFNGTIRENLLYANPEATEEQLIEACKKANIYDFVQKQEKGLDAMVGNRGLKLSGGEKQRISIARVLLKDPALLIFDEATSALDSISEQKIQDAIDPIIAERTSILIAHRLSTILAADEIIVVKDGEIVERGKHAELVKRGGTYTELYETQFKKALLEKEEFVPTETEDTDYLNQE
ncbi:MAG: ABC transporter ATP-binding protein [Clostridia bacterium]|nr:ABC transporter ATP-binding protein [Clostridia bacterium]MBQ2111337.1 ABC transporter ATP-binding protein [Clostridia bacterium]MBQ3939210.1 ABC transporter ATP-binding protein [Clostridia bacterium]MBQ5487883.1 ABC transporter ATP-binding protein [Clostridia bacterium]